MSYVASIILSLQWILPKGDECSPGKRETKRTAWTTVAAVKVSGIYMGIVVPCMITSWCCTYTQFMLYSTKWWQGKTDKFSESGAIRQSFTQPNLYHKNAGIDSAMNQIMDNMHGWN